MSGNLYSTRSKEKGLKCPEGHKTLSCQKSLPKEKKGHSLIGTKLKCDLCDSSFYNKYTLRHHVNAVHKSMYRCKVCKKLLGRPTSLKRHMYTHTGQKPHPCSICSLRFRSKSDIRRHFSRVHGYEAGFTCYFCSIHLQSLYQLQQHFQQHTLEIPTVKFCKSGDISKGREWQCRHCQEVFHIFGELSLHKKLHRGEVLEETCPVCDLKFHNLKLHHRQRHSKIRKRHLETLLKCDECPKRFGSKDILQYHTESQHLRLSCPVCQKYLSGSSSLRRHMWLHSGKKPYECPVCLSKFELNVSLDFHIRSNHSEDKPFGCYFCKTSFWHTELRNQHLLRHLRELPYKSSCCQKAFTTLSRLRRHERKSGNEDHLRPQTPILFDKEKLKCDFCAATFLDRKLLRGHMKLVHRRTFRCPICPKVYGRQVLLTEHMYTHTGQKPHSCHLCQTTYRHECSLRYHLEIHHTSEGGFPCYFCLNYFDSMRKLWKHLSQHTMETPVQKSTILLTKVKLWECKFCEKKLESIRELLKHKKIHLAEGDGEILNCDLCNKSYESYADLRRHRRVHSEEKPFHCDTCPQSFKTQSHVNKHKVLRHSVPKFRCNFCFEHFPTQPLLYSHIKRHLNEQVFQCDICPKTFFSRPQLTSHGKVHFEREVLNCDECEERFYTKNSLKHHIEARHLGHHRCTVCSKVLSGPPALRRHMLIHTGEKPFECPICFIKLRFKSLIVPHVRRLHSDDKSFPCYFCRKRFREPESRKIHLLRHLRERPFKCEPCAKEYSSNSELIRHRKHPNHILNSSSY